MEKEKHKKKVNVQERLDKEMLEFYKERNKQENSKKKEIEKLKKNRVKNILFLLVIPSILSFATVIIVGINIGFSFITIFYPFCFSFIFVEMIMDLIVTKNEERYYKNIKIMFELITLLILSGQFYVSINQKDILLKQTQILEQTSQSTKADLLLVSSQGNRAYFYGNLIEGKNEQIAIAITNLGKATAPFIIVSMDSNLFTGYKKDLSDGNPEFILRELKSLDYNSTFFKLWINPDQDKNISFGKKDVTFKIKCPYCKIPISYQNISICVYKEDKIKECGEDWV